MQYAYSRLHSGMRDISNKTHQTSNKSTCGETRYRLRDRASNFHELVIPCNWIHLPYFSIRHSESDCLDRARRLHYSECRAGADMCCCRFGHGWHLLHIAKCDSGSSSLSIHDNGYRVGNGRGVVADSAIWTRTELNSARKGWWQKVSKGVFGC